ncbi:putative dienelactone hydrolase [Sphingomonas sp. UYAg733]
MDPLKRLADSLILAAFALLATAAPAFADVVGEAHRVTTMPSAAVRDATHSAELRVTIWYPAKVGTKAAPLVIGPPAQPIFAVGEIAADAPFAADAAGRKRAVILLSHGFGGSARMMGWFGIALARAGYVVIAVDHPGNNGIDTMTVPGAFLWWERPEDLKRALQAMAEDKEFGPHLDLKRVGASGFSAGGYTALTLGGARADPNRFLVFCNAHPQDGVCKPQIEFKATKADRDQALLDPQVAALQAVATHDHSLPSVKAVFAIAPALIQALDPRSLAVLRKPVGMIVGDADTIAEPGTNARVAARLIPGAKLSIVPGAGHYTFLSTCLPGMAATVKLCELAGPQAAAHELAIRQALILFGRYLGAP